MRLPRVSRTVVALIIVALIVVGLVLVFRQPWQRLQKVLSAPLPDSGYVIELWEKPYWFLGLGYEYETWFVVKSSHEGERWYLIDAQYITFTEVTILASSDLSTIRVETTGVGTGSHMIAEYDLQREKFRSVSEPTVKNTRGWTVLSEAHIH